MRHHDRLQHVRDGSDYQAPLRAINDTIEGLVHCALIVRDHEVTLTPETRALDAIGVQVERELKNRAEMIQVLVTRCNVLEAFVRDARAKGYITDAETLDSLRDGAQQQRPVLVNQVERAPFVIEPS